MVWIDDLDDIYEVRAGFFKLLKKYKAKQKEVDELEDKLTKRNQLYGKVAQSLGEARKTITELEEEIEGLKQEEEVSESYYDDYCAS